MKYDEDNKLDDILNNPEKHLSDTDKMINNINKHIGKGGTEYIIDKLRQIFKD